LRSHSLLADKLNTCWSKKAGLGLVGSSLNLSYHHCELNTVVSIGSMTFSFIVFTEVIIGVTTSAVLVRKSVQGNAPKPLISCEGVATGVGTGTGAGVDVGYGVGVGVGVGSSSCSHLPSAPTGIHLGIVFVTSATALNFSLTPVRNRLTFVRKRFNIVSALFRTESAVVEIERFTLFATPATVLLILLKRLFLSGFACGIACPRQLAAPLAATAAPRFGLFAIGAGSTGTIFRTVRLMDAVAVFTALVMADPACFEALLTTVLAFFATLITALFTLLNKLGFGEGFGGAGLGAGRRGGADLLAAWRGVGLGLGFGFGLGFDLAFGLGLDIDFGLAFRLGLGLGFGFDFRLLLDNFRGLERDPPPLDNRPPIPFLAGLDKTLRIPAKVPLSSSPIGYCLAITASTVRALNNPIQGSIGSFRVESGSFWTSNPELPCKFHDCTKSSAGIVCFPKTGSL